jgi:hypothetical protein
MPIYAKFPTVNRPLKRRLKMLEYFKKLLWICAGIVVFLLVKNVYQLVTWVVGLPMTIGIKVFAFGVTAAAICAICILVKSKITGLFRR